MAIAAGKVRALTSQHHEAALLYEVDEGLANLLAGLGALDDTRLRAAFAAIQQEARAILWPEAVGPDWAERLGAPTYEQLVFLQDLAKVAFHPAPDDGVELAPWEPTHLEATLGLLEESHRDTVAGLLLTMPRAPSRAGYAAALAEVQDRFLPAASYVARAEGRLIGVVLGLADPEVPGRAFLLGLATDPAYRSRQVGRRLVMAMQRALLELGYAEMGFVTTSANAPVHRLFRLDEVRLLERVRGGYWLRPGT